MSVLLAPVGGAALSWYLDRHQAAPPPDPAAADAGSVAALFSLQKREQFLHAAVDQYADPGNDPGNVRDGVKFAVELGLLYLDDKVPRLDDAEHLFKKLIDNPHNVRAYGAVGRLGLGVVLAFRNRPEESDRLFLEVLEKRPDGKRFDGLLQQLTLNVNFRHKLVEALDYNAKNLEAMKQKVPPGDGEVSQVPPEPTLPTAAARRREGAGQGHGIGRPSNVQPRTKKRTPGSSRKPGVRRNRSPSRATFLSAHSAERAHPFLPWLTGRLSSSRACRSGRCRPWRKS